MPFVPIIAFCVLALLRPAGPLASQEQRGVAQSSASVETLLGRYVESIDTHRPIQLPAVDMDRARGALGRLAPGFLSSTTEPDRQERQRRLLTTFALELAASGSSRDSEAAARLVEWACDQIRSHSPQDEFDRTWQRAALTVLEGGINARALLQHVNHMKPHFDDDPRLILARAIVEEQSIAPSEVRDGPTPRVNPAKLLALRAEAAAERTRTAERAIERFDEASREPAVVAEARLRMGHVQLGLGKYNDALASWKELEQITDDRALVYLASLFRGLGLEGLNRPAEARAAYQAALKISPGAHSATMRLAALTFRGGRGEEADRLLASLLRNADPRRDPWWSYYAADWRFWYPRIERVRVLVDMGSRPGR